MNPTSLNRFHTDPNLQTQSCSSEKGRFHLRDFRKTSTPDSSSLQSLVKTSSIFARKGSREMLAEKSSPRLTERQVNGIVEIKGALISVTARVKVKIKTQGFLAIDYGDKVTILDTEGLQPGYFVAEIGGKVGRVLCRPLQLGKHVSNLYLEIVDHLVAQPKLLEKLLEGEFYEVPQHRSYIASLLYAGNMMDIVLKNLLQKELNRSKNKNLKGEAFRGITPATLLIRSILNCPGELQEFRASFVKFLISQIRGKHVSIEKAVSVAEKGIQYLNDLPDDQIPDELSFFMSTWRSAVKENGCSIFFLRFINPALIEPLELCKLKGLTAPVIECLRCISKIFQLIANQTTPREGQDAFTQRDRLERLWGPTKAFVDKIAALPVSMPEVNQSLIIPAASIYALSFKFLPDEASDLIKRLGSPPKLPIQAEEEVPMYDRIKYIADYIERQSL